MLIVSKQDYIAHMELMMIDDTSIPAELRSKILARQKERSARKLVLLETEKQQQADRLLEVVYPLYHHDTRRAIDQVSDNDKYASS